jgi:hypothetical protein
MGPSGAALGDAQECQNCPRAQICLPGLHHTRAWDGRTRKGGQEARQARGAWREPVGIARGHKAGGASVRCGVVRSRERARVQAIGVSETCCFACQQYLKHRGVLHSGSHGNVAIWIPPQDADREALRHMHEQLRVRLRNFFFAEKERSWALKWDAEDELLMRSLDLSKEPEAAEMSDYEEKSGGEDQKP